MHRDGRCAISKIGVTGLELGTRYRHEDNMTLKLRAEAACGNTKLKKIVFGAYTNFEISDKAFLNMPALEEIHFRGKPVAKAEMDKILNGIAVPENGEIKTCIYASSLIGWAAYAVEPTAAESEHKPAGIPSHGVIGVYAGANGQRKAWIVHEPSDYDPKGTVLILR